MAVHAHLVSRASIHWTSDPKKCNTISRPSRTNGRLPHEWSEIRQKKHRQSIGGQAPVPNPMSFRPDQLTPFIRYRGVKIQLFTFISLSRCTFWDPESFICRWRRHKCACTETDRTLSDLRAASAGSAAGTTGREDGERRPGQARPATRQPAASIFSF